MRRAARLSGFLRPALWHWTSLSSPFGIHAVSGSDMCSFPPPPFFFPFAAWKSGAACLVPLAFLYVNPGPIPFRRLFLSSLPRPLCFPPLYPSPRLVPGPWFKMADGAAMEKVRAPTSRGVPVAVLLMLVLQHIQFGTRHLRVPAEQIFENRTVFRLRTSPNPTIARWLAHWMPQPVLSWLVRFAPRVVLAANRHPRGAKRREAGRELRKRTRHIPPSPISPGHLHTALVRRGVRLHVRADAPAAAHPRPPPGRHPGDLAAGPCRRGAKRRARRQGPSHVHQADGTRRRPRGSAASQISLRSQQGRDRRCRL